MNVIAPKEKLAPKDYASDQEVRWCPGCGDYAILKAVQKTLADIEASPDKTVFISGIGCAARFPYYLETYGFHTIHGRAPSIATGVKLANPELDVWIASGDGDALSIGGNHLMHLLRRNPDVQLLLFNNEIYGLTKGQASPTSQVGTRTPSTPGGSMDRPISAARLALGAGARFFARGVDTQQKHLPGIFARAHAHKGTSLVEIFQNCIVYNPDVFANFTDRDVADERQIHLEHGQPMLFGKERNRGLRLDAKRLCLEAVTVGEGDGEVPESEILVHDETNLAMAQLLAAMEPPALPVALGVLYCDPVPSYDAQIEAKRTQRPVDGGQAAGLAGIDALLRDAHTWTV